MKAPQKLPIDSARVEITREGRSIITLCYHSTITRGTESVSSSEDYEEHKSDRGPVTCEPLTHHRAQHQLSTLSSNDVQFLYGSVARNVYQQQYSRAQVSADEKTIITSSQAAAASAARRVASSWSQSQLGCCRDLIIIIIIMVPPSHSPPPQECSQLFPTVATTADVGPLSSFFLTNYSKSQAHLSSQRFEFYAVSLLLSVPPAPQTIASLTVVN